MKTKKAKELLGCQLWVERTDSRERIFQLVQKAADTGLGWLRIFLLWPWIEEQPGHWDFQVFDDTFDAAEKYGLRIKATLTANSGPWHIGTPSLLHSHTGFLDREQEPAARQYVTQCVQRYRNHPALGQWLLWNEPVAGQDRTEETLELWRAFLKGKYHDDLRALNHRWRTGYASFNEIPFAEHTTHPLHAENHWRSYRPYLDDRTFCSQWLLIQLERIKQWVREQDPVTEICVNPSTLLENLAAEGLDLEAMGRLVDIIGASYHPAWGFTYANRSLFPALMAVGIRKQAAYPSVRRVEITEVQSGNTLNSSNRPCAVDPSELARFYISGLFAGAESVTGWLFNVRSYDFEAGDWGLLDDSDRPSVRSRMMRKIHDCLKQILAKTGGWKPVDPVAWIGVDQGAQALETQDCRCAEVPGRTVNDGARGAALLNALLLEEGISSSIQQLDYLPADGSKGGLILLSHVVAWEETQGRRLLNFVQSGGTLAFDATCGRKTPDAKLHRPWPGGIARELGLEASGLESNPEGYEVSILGTSVGKWLLTRMTPGFAPDAGWRPWEELRFIDDSSPCVWERSYGKGRVVFINGLLGPSLVHEPKSYPIARYLLHRLGAKLADEVRPVPGNFSAFALPNHCLNGSLTAILANSQRERNGQDLRVIVAPGTYEDCWTGLTYQISFECELAFPAVEGIVLLWRKDD